TYANLKIQHHIREANTVHLPQVRVANSVTNEFKNALRFFQDAVTLGEAEFLNKGQQRLKAAMQALNQLDLEREEDLHLLKQQQRCQAELAQYIEKTSTVYPKLISNMEDKALLEEAGKLFKRGELLRDHLIQLQEEIYNQVKKQLDEVQLASARRLRDNIITAFSIALIALIAVYLIVRRFILYPLQETVAFARQFGAGRFGQRIPVRRRDEIGVLALNLNYMAERLQNTIRELEHQQEHLEELVKERTRELEEDIQRRLQAEARFKAAFHTNPATMVISKLENGEIVELNDAFTRLFGYTREEAIGKTGYELNIYLEDDSREVIKESLKTTGRYFNSDFKLRNREGETLHTVLACELLKIDDVNHILVVIIDITEQKRMEEKLAEAQKQLLENAHLAGKAEVATEVLHNVGNVLNSVGVTVSQLYQTIEHSRIKYLDAAVAKLKENAQVDSKLTSFFAKMSESLLREHEDITNHINRLRDFTQHITDIISLQQTYSRNVEFKEHIAIDEIVENAINIHRASFERHGMQLEFIPSKLPPRFWQRAKILQIIINLIRNAKDALLESQAPDKKLKIWIVHSEDENMVHIHVKDNGIGISKENLDKIFQHGFTTKKHGHGFGLHSCANIAREMGGDLTVRSEGEGKGAEFILSLSYQDEPLPAGV
ncbi:MAG: PAS domain S-box protein, partial [Lentisphaerae bacterium]